jgi:hypothetical protein
MLLLFLLHSAIVDQAVAISFQIHGQRLSNEQSTLVFAECFSRPGGEPIIASDAFHSWFLRPRAFLFHGQLMCTTLVPCVRPIMKLLGMG